MVHCIEAAAVEVGFVVVAVVAVVLHIVGFALVAVEVDPILHFAGLVHLLEVRLQDVDFP